MAEKKNVFVFQILLPLTLQVVIVSWVIYDMSSDYKKYKFFAKKFELYFFVLEKRKVKSMSVKTMHFMGQILIHKYVQNTE